MRHTVNTESRVHGSTLDYGHTLSLLEEDWNNTTQMGTPSSVSSSLFDTCRCCGRQDCDSIEYFNRNIKKLESDTRLAAGKYYIKKNNNKRKKNSLSFLFLSLIFNILLYTHIIEIGQGLLHKHETYVTESNGQKSHLEKQVNFFFLHCAIFCVTFKLVGGVPRKNHWIRAIIGSSGNAKRRHFKRKKQVVLGVSETPKGSSLIFFILFCLTNK